MPCSNISGNLEKPWKIQMFDHLDSTQNYLKSFIENTPSLIEEGTVICARAQTNGIGRHGRKWEGAEGNLYLSLYIAPDCLVQNAGHLSMITALSVVQAVNTALNQNIVRIKWPNDLMIKGQKCGGILIDVIEQDGHVIKSAIIGLGLNIAHAPIEHSTCLSDHAAHIISCTQAMDVFLERFFALYYQWKEEGITPIYHDYLEYTHKNGDRVSVKLGGKHIKGTFENIDISGNLILIDDQSGGAKTVSSGDIINF